MLQLAEAQVVDDRFHGLVRRVLEITRSSSTVMFLCDRKGVEPEVHYLFMHGLTPEVPQDYSDRKVYRCDPFLNRAVLKCRGNGHGSTIIDANDDDVRQCSNTEDYWQFARRHDLLLVGATVRPIREDLLLVFGVHGKTGAKSLAIANAAEEIEALVDSVMSRAFQAILEKVEIRRLLEAAESRESASTTAWPSRRENEIIRLVKQGLRNKQIAFELQISENTVETHLRRIYHKMGVRNRTSLINRHDGFMRL